LLDECADHGGVGSCVLVVRARARAVLAGRPAPLVLLVDAREDLPDRAPTIRGPAELPVPVDDAGGHRPADERAERGMHGWASADPPPAHRPMRGPAPARYWETGRWPLAP